MRITGGEEDENHRRRLESQKEMKMRFTGGEEDKNHRRRRENHRRRR
jgi:hypothetical protein